jgi:hypothetical protein
MLQTTLTSPVASQPRARFGQGVVSEHADEFAEWLHQHGYKLGTIADLMRSLAAWTDWINSSLTDGLNQVTAATSTSGLSARRPNSFVSFKIKESLRKTNRYRLRQPYEARPGCCADLPNLEKSYRVAASTSAQLRGHHASGYP